MNVVPILPVGDLDVAEGLHTSLGFEVVRHDDEYAFVLLDDRELWHLSVVSDLDPATNHTAVHVEVDDVDAVYEQLRAEAAEVSISTPLDQPWGMREFVVVDPFGNRVRVGTAID